jgi:hypothetical protein
VRREVGGAPAAREALAALGRALPMWGCNNRHASNRLDVLARGGRWNCLAGTSLAVALAERLGLPVFAVHSPGHVFVRWDDGTVRRSLETTAPDQTVSDLEYLNSVGNFAASKEAVANGLYLRNLDRREFFGYVLTAAAIGGLPGTGPEPDPAPMAFAEAAVRLDDQDPSAYLARGLARLSSDRTGAGEDLARAAAMEPNWPIAAAALDAYSGLGAPPPGGPWSPECAEVRALVFHGLGDPAAVRRELTPLAEKGSLSDQARGLLFVARFRLAATEDGWFGRTWTPGRADEALAMVEELLLPRVDRAPKLAEAGRILDRLSYLDDRTVVDRGVRFPREWSAERHDPKLRERYARLRAEVDRRSKR